jgi:hypothetical protein
MDIPFALRFLRMIEAFQVVNKLNGQFDVQVESFDGTVPLWEVEKKVLFWTYKSHMHLGSPLEFHRLKKDMKFSEREYDRLGVRQMFGNLVSRGYASFYPIHQYKEMTSPDQSTRSTRVLMPGLQLSYELVPTDQASAEGVIITSEGLLVGELLNQLYTIEPADENEPYAGISGASHVLKKKFWSWKFYNFIILLGYGVLILLAVYVLRELFGIGKELKDWIINFLSKR